MTEQRKRRLQRLLSEQPDATLAELGARMDRPFRTSTIRFVAAATGLAVYKKTLFAARTKPARRAEKRARWHEPLAAEPVSKLVFVDESGAPTQMTRGRGPGARRTTTGAHVPLGDYQTSTLISGIRLSGPCAPWLFQGPLNGEMFLAWITQGLAPTLQQGDVVHSGQPGQRTKSAESARPSKAVGARLLYLPPYSPDFNPIRTDVEQNQANPAQPCSPYGKRLAPGQQSRLPSHFHHRLPRLLFSAPIRYMIYGIALSPLDLAIAPNGNIVVSSGRPFGAVDAVDERSGIRYDGWPPRPSFLSQWEG